MSILQISTAAPRLVDRFFESIDVPAFLRAAQSAANELELRRAFSVSLQPSSIPFFEFLRFSDNQPIHPVWQQLPDNLLKRNSEAWSVACDLIVRRAVRAGVPLSWPQSNGASSTDSDAAWSWLEIMRDHGVRSGFTVPIHGAGDIYHVFHFGRDCDPANEVAEIGLCTALAFIASTRLRQIEESSKHREREVDEPQLSARELEILSWSKDGKSYAEIGTILGISAKTVEYHIANAMRKLGVNQKISAIMTAIRNGWIQI